MKRTIIDLFEGTVAKFGDKEFLVEKHGSKWDSTTYNEAKAEVLRGDRVLMAERHHILGGLSLYGEGKIVLDPVIGDNHVRKVSGHDQDQHPDQDQATL